MTNGDASVGLSSAIFGIDAGIQRAPGDASARMQADRERLTRELRLLSGGLDELDRRLSSLDWTRGATLSTCRSEVAAQRRELEAQRTRLNSRLRDLARQLSDLDCALSAMAVHPHVTASAVGVCPQCGYPSLSSALCARCRSFSVV